MQSDKFQNKYRIASTRLQNWDYGSDAMYFVTICTQGREYYFGEMVDGIMKLSEIGEIVETEWIKTFELRQDIHLQMGEFIIMPDTDTDKYHNQFGPQSKNLASIIRGFKSAVTIGAHQFHTDFAWQPRFHDHIIRNDESFRRISNYIKNNPSNWKEDKMTLK